jgi:hypothetical protein
MQTAAKNSVPILIGSELPAPRLLLIDYAANTVEIEAQRPASA